MAQSCKGPSPFRAFLWGAPPPDFLRVGLKRPIDFDAIAVAQYCTGRGRFPVNSCARRIDFRKFHGQAARPDRVRQRASLGERDPAHHLPSRQSVYDIDDDCAHALPKRVSARRTNASTKLSAKWWNAGPAVFASNALENS